ncbi:trypsin-like serine protease [Vibrio amylolyticus]|uniref:trypsin-like serine protease n=1 Tax=Vibrio amylolyticus TaxID=2847292 RepID=UPI0035516258
MKKILSTAFTMAALVCSMNANAIKNGSDVSASEYKDYIVRIELQNTSGGTASCGALLVGGNYLLTAGHCVGSYNWNGTNVDYQWFVDNGATNAIRIYQGVDFNSDTYTDATYSVEPLLDTSGKETAAYNVATSEYTAVKAQNVGGNWAVTDTIINNAYHTAVWHRDIALLKLNKSVAQVDHAAMVSAYDQTDDSLAVAINDTLTFRGWGKTETGSYPTVMQKTTVTNTLADSTFASGVATGAASAGLCLNDGSACTYDVTDYFTFTPPTVGDTGNDGDSGTPLVLNSEDKVVGVTKDTDYSTNTRFTTLSFYLPSIKDAINKVTAPSSLAFETTTNSTSGITHKFTIQNVTGGNETLAPYLSGANGMYTLSGCSVTLATMESCELTLQVNPSNTAISATHTATLNLTDANDTQIPISYSVSSNSGTESGTGTGSASGGGGGSMGFGFLFAMFSLGIWRKNR